jgi:hypothetical protein
MIKQEDLDKFRGQYPYGSELFGVYQTLLGWRGARARRWFLKGYAREHLDLSDSIYRKVRANVEAPLNADRVLGEIGRIGVGLANDRPKYSSKLVETLARLLPDGGQADDPQFWRDHLTDDRLLAVLNRDVREEARQMLEQQMDPNAALDRLGASPQARSQRALQFLEHESRTAGQLRILRDASAAGELKHIFHHHSTTLDRLSLVAHVLATSGPFNALDPENILGRTVVSPIGIIHLYRQYFFELDSFLGSPVGHVWVAPHTTVELVEVNKRRTLTESLIDESAFARLEQFDESFSLENLHEAVSVSNQQDLSFGASVSGSHSWIVGSVQASASMNYHQTQSESRLAVHDLMRRQTQRISSLMETSMRTTFKTVTEKEEVSSKRYTVANPGDEMINYELRRKMRRVAVQVQDVGTYLSWQTFVDDPGREIGVAQLVHIAEPPNLANIPHPQMIEPKPTKTTVETVMIPFQPQDWPPGDIDAADDDDNDQTFEHGIESSIGYLDDPEGIKWIFPQKFRAPDKDYKLAAVKATPHGDADILVNAYDPMEFTDLKDGYFEFRLYLERVHFHDAPSIPVQLELTWESTEDQAKIKAENDKRLNTFLAEQKRAYEEAYMKAARERITAASKIAPRRYEDLRQEERIAVYRRLVRSLAPTGEGMTDDEILSGNSFSYPDMSDETRHAWSEVLNRIFDLEKMLYFVAPEWWKPRARSAQTMGAETVVVDAAGNVVKQEVSQGIPERSTVSWGGGAEAGRPNYYITEGSAIARLGSSLGWLLQLDGDAMRNAFLNAPWVKAIVPIRPGREREAIDWLKGVMEGDEGLDAALEQQLRELSDKVAAKHAKADTVATQPDPLQPDDPNATVSSTPVDRVFEFGFDPLAGGFRAQSIEGNEFEIIDQWIEVVPTDQVAAVSVQYDPITGRQIPPA